MNKKKRMQELVKLLNEASRTYYQEAREIMGITRNCLRDEVTGPVTYTE